MTNITKYIAFRVDASPQIGTGHFMRCFTLASRLLKDKVHLRFISRHLPDHFRCMLAEQNIEFALLDSGAAPSAHDDLAHAQWLGVSQSQDAEDSIKALAGHAWDWIIVDHYALDARWETAVRSICKRIFVIDDIADRLHDCDLLLDQNLYIDMPSRYIDKVPAHCRVLLGPRYALLRDEFHQAREAALRRDVQVRRVLVFFGGIDAHNFTAHAIAALARIGRGLAADIVIGSLHPQRTEIEKSCLKYNFTCHVQTDRFAKLLARADLSIGAGGSSVWERACLGVPTLTISTAANQSEQVADAAFEGLIYAPELSSMETPDIWIERHVRALMENRQLRELISRRAKYMVDAHGASRIAVNLECGGIELRLAGTADSNNIFEWRNHPTVRESSRNSSVICWENHRKWFLSTINNPDKVMLIGYRCQEPVGVVRFDCQGDEAEISIYLVQTEGNSGQGYNLLLSAEHWIKCNYPATRIIRAAVLDDNKRSQRLFSDAGYSIEFSHYLKRI